MIDYTELVKALRSASTVSTAWEKLMCDAADAIEKLVALYEKAEMDATNLTGKLAQAEAEVERLKDSNAEQDYRP